MDEMSYINLPDNLFKKMTLLLFKESGITLREHKKYLFINRLSRFVGDDKEFKNFEEYYQALVHDYSGRMVSDFINMLTTNYSYFFREELHFNLLKNYLINHYLKESYIRLWSAGCSTGEEPYSMAMVCARSIPDYQNTDIKILATDISTKVLKFAEEGIYKLSKIKDIIDEKDLKVFFNIDRNNDNCKVKKQIKELIAFRYLNIMERYPFKKDFDMVFLRNVLIYFDNREKEIILNKIYDHIKLGGFLVLGLSESMVGIPHKFESMKNSIFKKKDGVV